jgi:protoporphyrinogen oxidase
MAPRMKTNFQTRTLILGGGLAGLSAAYFLGKDCIVLERESVPGGLSRSVREDGFVFDYGGHALHSKQEDWYALLKRLQCELFIQERKAFVETPDGAIPFPFQYHLSRLPEAIYRECLEGLSEPVPETGSGIREPRSYLKWLEEMFGPGICRHFMIPYNRKIWKIDLGGMTDEFASQRVPAQERRRLIEINSRAESAYSQTVAYPASGGIQAIPDAFRARVQSLRCGAEVTGIDCTAGTVTVNGGETYGYERLISTIPLPRFLELAGDLPEDVRRCGPKLDWLSLSVVNLGIKKERLTEKQRLYVAHPDVPFHKVVFNMNSAPDCAPPGHGSVSVEITHRRNERPDPGKIMERSLDHLIRLKVLSPSDPVVFRQVLSNEFGYILYDRERTPAVDHCRRHLETRNVHLCGRFGEWAYLNMDAVVESARRTVEKIA